jgi:RNA polymerase sigma-70 factor (ECF subfamily)
LPSEGTRDEVWHDALVQRSSDEIKRYLVRRLSGDLHTAEELLQETFLTAWRKRAELTDDPIRWLYVTARLLLQNYRRQQRKRTILDLGAVELPMRHATASADNNEYPDLAKALRGLSENDRFILDCRYYEGLTDEQIALRLDLNPAAVRKRVSRALMRARKLLPEHWDPDAKG